MGNALTERARVAAAALQELIIVRAEVHLDLAAAGHGEHPGVAQRGPHVVIEEPLLVLLRGQEAGRRDHRQDSHQQHHQHRLGEREAHRAGMPSHVTEW